MNYRTAFFYFLFLSYTSILKGQSFSKADEQYRNGYWATAIPLYEAALKKKDNTPAKSKLADCYRRLNKAEQAATLYTTLTAEKKIDPFDVLRFGEVLMMQAKYDSAKLFFQRYTELNPDDERGYTYIKACDNIKEIKPMLLDIDITPFVHNTEADENAPVFYRGKLLFVSDREQGFKLMQKKNETIGREYQIIWGAERVNDTAYLETNPFSSDLTSINQNTSSASFTANGREVFICKNSGDYNRKGSNKDRKSTRLNSSHVD